MKKRGLIVILALMIALLAAGCSSGSGDSASTEADDGFAKGWTESWEESGEEGVPAADGALPGETVETNRKLMRTAELTLETQNFDASLEGVRALVSEMGGYMERSEVDNDGDGARTAELTARVPSDRFAQTSEALEALGNVRSSLETADDITDEYYDVQAELEALRVQQERLLALMEQAANIEDLMALEEELTQVRYRINDRTSMLKRYDGLVDYATFHITLWEVERLSTQAPVLPGFGQRVGETFLKSMGHALDFGQRLILVLVAALPFVLVYGGFAAVVAIVVVLVVRLAQRRGGKRRSAKKSE